LPMNEADRKISGFLKELSLDEENINIYITLAKKGILTALELARETGINRTRVYRILESLREQGLVEEIIDEYRRKNKAVGPESLARLIKEQETKTEKLKSQFPEVATLLSGNIGLNKDSTKVLFYRGKDGIKQMVWNTLRTKGECLGYSYINLDDALGKDLAEKWRYEIVARNIKFRDITCEMKYFEYSEHTKVAGYNDLSQTRYIPKEQLHIDHQVDIYNDVIAFYSWKVDDIFGVEIYNKTIVRMQKQIFNLVWKLAKEV